MLSKATNLNQQIMREIMSIAISHEKKSSYARICMQIPKYAHNITYSFMCASGEINVWECWTQQNSISKFFFLVNKIIWKLFTKIILCMRAFYLLFVVDNCFSSWHRQWREICLTLFGCLLIVCQQLLDQNFKIWKSLKWFILLCFK